MERKPDVRNSRTKMEISNAFKELIRRKQINKITVSDLVKYCGINRNTFYYHFEDIYDLINWTFDEEVKVIINSIGDNSYDVLFNAIIDYIVKNKHILNSFYTSFGTEQLRRILYPHFYAVLNAIISTRIIDCNASVDEEFKGFLIRFYAGGLSEIIVRYCNDEESPLPRDTLIEYLFALFNSIPIK